MIKINNSYKMFIVMITIVIQVLNLKRWKIKCFKVNNIKKCLKIKSSILIIKQVKIRKRLQRKKYQ
jgi:hypothetical protein